ncbi:MAG: cytochrome c [Dehalococcoidia bacterium]|nr:cytochrome c [Dehalococcoidia bacterium]
MGSRNSTTELLPLARRDRRQGHPSLSTEHWKRALTAVGVAAVLTAACSNPNAAGPFNSPGGKIYLSQCAGCHGAQAQGGVGPPFDAAGHAHHHSDAELAQTTTEGIARPGQPATMPAWRDRLTPQQLSQVIEFMKLLWTPEQRAQQQALNPQ